MNIQTKLCRSDNCGGKRTQKIQFLVIHYTANYGDTAKNNVDYFAREHVGASAHYFVDETAIWQSVPDDQIAWHCGANTYYHTRCRNSNSIGIEICMLDKRGNIRQESIDNAAKLTAFLMEKYQIPVTNVVRHYDVTHKNCPAPMVEDSGLWTAFLNRLEDENMNIEKFSELMNEYQNSKSTNQASNWSKEAREFMVENGLISGTGSNINGEPNYAWGRNLNREELVTVLYRILKYIGKA